MAGQRSIRGAIQPCCTVLLPDLIVGRKAVADAAMAEDAPTDDMQARFCSLTVQEVWLLGAEASRHHHCAQEETAVSCHAVGAGAAPLASLNVEAGAEWKEW